MSVADISDVIFSPNEYSGLGKRVIARRDTLQQLQDINTETISFDQAQSYLIPCVCFNDLISEVAEQSIPVLFATFLNLLEVVAYGAVFLPKCLGNTTGMMTELLIVTTVISQVVYVYMSEFSSAISTEMCDNIPFMQTMALGIYSSVSGGDGDEGTGVERALPTFLAAMCVSTLFNGILFTAIGYLKLGKVLHVCPRYVILGMGTGFGLFMILTGVEIAIGLPCNWHSMLHLTADMRMQLLVSLSAVLCLRLMNHCKLGEIAVSAATLAIPIIFHVAIVVSGCSLEQARARMWLFEKSSSSSHWYDTWSAVKPSLIDWPAVAQQAPTILCLALYTVLVIPLRIPALGLLTGEDVDFDKELRCLGVSNIIAAVFISPQNLLAYGNSAMYHGLRGRGKLSRMAVAVCTMGLFFVGPRIADYLPRVIASVIMFQMGCDLLVSNLYNSSKALDRLEYSCTVILGTVVLFYGFVAAMGASLILSCLTVAIESSRDSCIHATYSGLHARSNTNWSSAQRLRLDAAVSNGFAAVFVVQLRGRLFFGNVQTIIDTVMQLLETNQSSRQPYQSGMVLSPLQSYVVLDFSYVSGGDINAVSGIMRLKRLLDSRAHVLFASVEPTLLQTFGMETQCRPARVDHSKPVDEESLLAFNLVSQTFFPSVNEALEAVEETLLSKLTGYSLAALGGSDDISESTRMNFHQLSRMDIDCLSPSDSLRERSDSMLRRERSGSSLADVALPTSRARLLSAPPAPHMLLELKYRSEIIDALFDLGAGQWLDSDGPPLKRLSQLFARNIVHLKAHEVLWVAGSEAVSMGLLLSGRLMSTHTLGGKSFVMAGTVVGHMGLMCLGVHHHTITAAEDSSLALLTTDDVQQVEDIDKPLYCVLQKIALLYVAARKNDLLLFDAGSATFSVGRRKK